MVASGGQSQVKGNKSREKGDIESSITLRGGGQLKLFPQQTTKTTKKLQSKYRTN